jgi:hypothetical protein
MPYLKISTNQPMEQAKRENLLQQASSQVAERLGKSEKYVMVELSFNPAMTFAGTTRPCPYVEMKSIGLVDPRTAAICKLLQTETDISPETHLHQVHGCPS